MLTVRCDGDEWPTTADNDFSSALTHIRRMRKKKEAKIQSRDSFRRGGASAGAALRRADQTSRVCLIVGPREAMPPEVPARGIERGTYWDLASPGGTASGTLATWSLLLRVAAPGAGQLMVGR